MLCAILCLCLPLLIYGVEGDEGMEMVLRASQGHITVGYQGDKPGWWLREELVCGGGEHSRHGALGVRLREIVLEC